MHIRIDSTRPASVTISEDPDGVNEPASVTILVNDLGKGELDFHLVGGDPTREGEDINKPTIVEGTWNSTTRTITFEEALPS